jgi:hypothetical protein
MNSSNFKFLLFIILVFALSAWMWNRSSQKVIRKLQGHWHSTSDLNITLDIIDTLAVVNRYSRIVPPDTFSLIDRELGSVVLPVHCGCGGGLFPHMTRFRVTEDHLHYDSVSDPMCYPEGMNFVRATGANCKMTHALSGYNSIAINNLALPAASAREYIETVPLPYGVVIIGHTDKNLGAGPKIQVNDVFITPGQIPEWIRERKELGKEWLFIWAIDETVPNGFLEEVFHNVPLDSSLHYRLVRSSDETHVQYEPINLAEY